MKSSINRVGILLAAVLKVVAWALMAFSIFAFLASRDRDPSSWRGFSTVLSVGLTSGFLLRERIDDERVHSLKLKALSIAFAIAYPLAMWLDPLRKRTESITAYEFICITMLIALGLFHFWRWQDGRGDRAGAQKIQST
jgi:hypothetical protein